MATNAWRITDLLPVNFDPAVVILDTQYSTLQLSFLLLLRRRAVQFSSTFLLRTPHTYAPRSLTARQSSIFPPIPWSFELAGGDLGGPENCLLNGQPDLHLPPQTLHQRDPWIDDVRYVGAAGEQQVISCVASTIDAPGARQLSLPRSTGMSLVPQQISRGSPLEGRGSRSTAFRGRM